VKNLFHSMALTMLTVAIFFGDCSCSGGQNNLQPVGFTIVPSLKIAGEGYVSPEAGKVFVVVAVQVPAGAAEPADSIVERDRTDPAFLSAARFSIITADGQTVTCSRIGGGVAWGFASYGNPPRTGLYKLAAELDAAEARPPFKIQIDKKSPVPVPDVRIDSGP
jgi:hypothetical protein